MIENEELLTKVLNETGTTILADYFTNYLREKKKKEIEASKPKNAMLPPSLINSTFSEQSQLAQDKKPS